MKMTKISKKNLSKKYSKTKSIKSLFCRKKSGKQDKKKPKKKPKPGMYLNKAVKVRTAYL